MSKDLAKQLKEVCDQRQNEYNEAAIAELERVKALLPRARVLVGMANELHRRGLHFGKRLSWWFKFTHYYPVTADPEYEFEVNGKYGIGFELRYIDDMALVSRFNNNSRAEICIFENGTIDIHGPDTSRIGISADDTVRETADYEKASFPVIASSERVAVAVGKLLDVFDRFEHDFNEYVKTVINQIGGINDTGKKV